MQFRGSGTNGNVLAVADSAGAVKKQYRYSPYGVAELVAETFANPLRYAAREWDADANLYFNRARWYDPQLQRFITQDPIGIEGGLNLYACAGNDPVNSSDPSGLARCTKIGLGRLGGSLTGPMDYDYECDYYGMPVADNAGLRHRMDDVCGGRTRGGRR